MAWEIKFSSKVDKTLEKLDPQSRKLIHNYLKYQVLNLDDPRLLGKALRRSLKGFWRYRVDKFRVICKLEEDKMVVLVIKIGKRDGVYEEV